MTAVFRLLVCLLLIVMCWLSAFVWYITAIGKFPVHPTEKGQAIVVLTGGGGRVEYGFELLAQGRGDALFISGVNENVPLGALIAKAPQTMRSLLFTISGQKIFIGRDARNTIGNAEESAEWVRQGNYKSILLVTADYHMPRSLIEFEQELPEVRLIPAAVITRDYRSPDWLSDNAIRNLLLSEFHKLIAARLRHMLFFE